MKIKYKKILVRQTMDEEVISQWVEPEGFNLACTALSANALKIIVNVACGPYKEFKRFMLEEFHEKTEHEDVNAIRIFHGNARESICDA